MMGFRLSRSAVADNGRGRPRHRRRCGRTCRRSDAPPGRVNTSASCRNFLSPLAALAAFSTRRFTISRSAIISSRSMVLDVAQGVHRHVGPASATTCMTFSSSKQRTTWTMASVRADVRQELVAQARALAGALHQAGNVHKFDDGGGLLVGLIHLRQLVQPLRPARPPCPRWARWCRRGSWRFRPRRW